MTWDSITDANIETLHPLIKDLVTKGINELYLKGIKVRVTFGNRSIEQQDKLYNQPTDGIDNDKDGKIDEADEKVTNAKGGQSLHNFGLAFDAVEIKPFYGYSPTYPERRWWPIIEVFEKLGFKSGKTFGDRPHFEMTFGYSLKEIQKLYKEQGEPKFLDIKSKV